MTVSLCWAGVNSVYCLHPTAHTSCLIVAVLTGLIFFFFSALQPGWRENIICAGRRNPEQYKTVPVLQGKTWLFEALSDKCLSDVLAEMSR